MENKEKYHDHEGSEEITQEQQYCQRYVYHHFLTHGLCQIFWFVTLLFCNHKRSSVVKCL